MTRHLLSLVLVLTTVFAAACGSDKPKPMSQDAGVDGSVDDAAVIDDAATIDYDAAVTQDAAMTPSDAGVDAGPTTDCHGSRSCDGLVGLQCVLAGCNTENDGTCGGTPAACSTYNGWGGAGRCFVSGCHFNVGNQKCTGTPKDCADVNIFACGGDNGVAGCMPSGACSGTPTPCSDDVYQSELACSAQPGCSWQ